MRKEMGMTSQPLTPEEFVQEFELLGPEDRLEVARLVIDAKVKADAAHGAYTFTKKHRCPDSIGAYPEGYADGADAGHKEGYRQGYDAGYQDAKREEWEQ